MRNCGRTRQTTRGHAEPGREASTVRRASRERRIPTCSHTSRRGHQQRASPSAAPPSAATERAVRGTLRGASRPAAMPNRGDRTSTSLVFANRSPGRLVPRSPVSGEFSSILSQGSPSRLGSPQALLVQKPSRRADGSESAILGLRSAVHASGAPVDDENRPKTYIVATYTDELSKDDEHERWFVPNPPSRPDRQLDPDELEIHRKMGLYTPTTAGTDASVYVELFGSRGSSGELKLSHGQTLKDEVQEQLDNILGKVSRQPEHAYGLRFEGKTTALTKEHMQRLDRVVLLLTRDYPQVKKVVVEGVLAPQEEDRDHPIHDRHPMYNREMTATKQIAYQRMKAVHDYLRRAVDPSMVGESFSDDQDVQEFAGRTFSSRLPMRLNTTLAEKSHKDFRAMPEDMRPPELRLIVEELTEEWNKHHAIFQPGHVDEFAITCNDLGDLHECKVWHKNDGVDMQSSRWKLDKVVVTCIQSHSSVGASGYAVLHPHGKGDTAIRSVKTSDSDQWHFLAHGHWLSVDRGSDLLIVNDEIRRASRRIHMVREETDARIRELQAEVKKLQQQKEKLKPGDEPVLDGGEEIVIPLEDHRPLPPALKKSWFEHEIYIDYRDPEENFSHLLTKTQDHAKPLQLILNGALEEDGSPAWDGGYIKPGCWGVPEGTERATLFKRTGDDGDDWHPGDPLTGCFLWKYVQLYLAGDYYSKWEVVRGYKPPDLDNGEKGERVEKGPRIDQAIWSLQRVGTSLRDREWGLFYIIKKDKEATWGLSINDEDLTRTEAVPAEARVLGLSADKQDWIIWAPHMVTHRGDEFIFEVRGKFRLEEQYSTYEWLDTYGGRTLSFGKGAVAPDACGRISNTCHRVTPCRLGTPHDEGDVHIWEEGKLGERGEEGDLLLTNGRWREGFSGEEASANHISPSLRGHQVWRLSIPAKKDDTPKEPYEPPEYKVYNFFMEWTHRAMLQALLIIGAVFGSAIWAGFAGGWGAFWASLGGTLLGTAVAFVVAILVVFIYVNISCAGRPLDADEERVP